MSKCIVRVKFIRLDSLVELNKAVNQFLSSLDGDRPAPIVQLTFDQCPVGPMPVACITYYDFNE